MVKKLPACYGIKKGRGAPVVVHSWAEVVAKVSPKANEVQVPEGPSPHESGLASVLGGWRGRRGRRRFLNPVPMRLALSWLFLSRTHVARSVPPSAKRDPQAQPASSRARA